MRAPAPRVVQFVPYRLPEQLPAAAAQQAFSRAVDVGEAPLVIQRGKGVGDAGQCRAQVHGQAQGLLVTPFNGEILQHTVNTQHRPVAAQNGLAERAHPYTPPAGREELRLFIKGHATRAAVMQRRRHPFARFMRVKIKRVCVRRRRIGRHLKQHGQRFGPGQAFA